MNYRPATKDDVGRTDWQFSPDGETWYDSDQARQYTILCKFARVPILPEECEPSGKVLSVQNVEGRLSDDEMLGMSNRLDPERYHKRVTIRRKLEAGGLAEAEQAILLDGRYYPVEWVKSSPGVLPQQCEVV